MKTHSLKEKEIKKNWILIDAKDIILGRLASQVSMILRGKNKPEYTPHMDCGDYVVIVNADKVHLTGRKADRNTGKVYYRHTGYLGGIKQITAGKLLEGKYPERVIMKAVERMITRNSLGRKQMTHLFVYKGAEHPHAAQNPSVLNIAEKNSKNIKR